MRQVPQEDGGFKFELEWYDDDGFGQYHATEVTFDGTEWTLLVSQEGELDMKRIDRVSHYWWGVYRQDDPEDPQLNGLAYTLEDAKEIADHVWRGIS